LISDFVRSEELLVQDMTEPDASGKHRGSYAEQLGVAALLPPARRRW
jgi:hypothetical protein